MSSCVIAANLRQDLANKFNDDADAGVLKIYSGASPGPNSAATGILLATLTLPAKTSNTVAGGVVTFGTLATVNAAATGTAGYGRILKADGTSALMDVDVGLTGASINLNSLAVTSGGAFSITSLSVTMPAGS